MQGAWCWIWKDWIDRRFMRRFQVLPEMGPVRAEQNDITVMRCAGCGSKIGSGVLERVLQTLDNNFDAARQVEDAANVSVPAGYQLLQSVDYFRSFVDDLYLFGRIAALHALGDMFAMGVKPDSAQVLAAVAYGSEEKQYQDLLQLMTGVKQTLDEHEVGLLGGHSSEAEQSACGLSVNGFYHPDDQLFSKSALQVGDQLILLKPLGSGVLFAADMRGKARGEWIDQALQTLLQSCWPAVDILRQHEVTACTDVTGFGLLGHLYEMLRASNCSAEIKLNSITAMAGALELIEQGIQSSLAPQNQQLRRVIDCTPDLAQMPGYSLLFDPQTAGGLLAAVAADEAESCLTALQAAGFGAASIVGQVLASEDSASSVRLL